MNLFLVISVVVFLIGAGYAQNCTLSDFPPKSNSGCCGRAVDSAKTSGSIARIGEYPWMGIVEYKKEGEEQFKLLCSAVLISGRYALSSGSCFSAQALKVSTPVSVRLGDYDVNNDGPDCVKTTDNGEDCTDGAISIPIEKYIKHPQYHRDNNRQNDITLIRLLRMVTYTDFIRPICMPSLDITLKAPKNLYMTVAGWGAVNATVTRSNVLRRVHVPYVDFYLCRHKYNTTSRITLNNGQLCAGSKNRDSCRGDTGGPLMLLKGQTTEVAGIVSFGPTPCGQETPGVYTKVFAYNDWVNATIYNYYQEMLTTEAVTTTAKKPTTVNGFDSDFIIFRE